MVYEYPEITKIYELLTNNGHIRDSPKVISLSDKHERETLVVYFNNGKNPLIQTILKRWANNLLEYNAVFSVASGICDVFICWCASFFLEEV